LNFDNFFQAIFPLCCQHEIEQQTCITTITLIETDEKTKTTLFTLSLPTSSSLFSYFWLSAAANVFYLSTAQQLPLLCRDGQISVVQPCRHLPHVLTFQCGDITD